MSADLKGFVGCQLFLSLGIFELLNVRQLGGFAALSSGNDGG
jgi:hypothetical protein